MHGRVLYVSLDPGARKTQVALRMEQICERLGVEQPENLILVHQTVFLDDPESVDSLLRHNPGPFVLVVIDPLYRALVGGDPAHAGAINAAIENVIRITDETGAAVMILNHDTKAGGMYGSKFLGAATDCKIFVKRDFKTNVVTLKVEMVKNGEPPEKPFVYKLDKEFLERTDRATKGNGKSKVSAFPHADMLALIPTTDTLKRDARKLVKDLLSGSATAQEKQWQRIRREWVKVGVGATVEKGDMIRRVVGEDVQ
jgi:hypothetical protein